MKINEIVEPKKLTLPTIEVGDEVLVGKFKNSKATVKGFTKDAHNQPVMKTTKGDKKVFKDRHSKLVQEDQSPALPVTSVKNLYHVGTLDASKKRDGYEGAGLSVSTHPDDWKKIARGHVTGDTYSATKDGNRFLNAHALTDSHDEVIKQWAIENGYLEQQETVTVCYYDDEMEDDLCSTFNSMADAEYEYDGELEHYDVEVDKGGIVPTDKLKKAARQKRMEATGVLDFVLPLYAEQAGLDGVWWQDTLDVSRYSAPRGVIVPSKIDSWEFKVNESIVEDGKIVQGVNTTVDVKPGETERQAAKFGNKITKKGPPILGGSSSHKLFNMGLGE
tara:strand:+ start:4720 stop:5718 length:999 start_codon:yes stop_codon:yes gene_type:complete